MAFSIKPYLPKGLFGRAALILLVPVIVVQLLVSVVFIQRHYDRVTVQLTGAVVREIAVLLPMIEAGGPVAQPDADVQRVAQTLAIQFRRAGPDEVPQADKKLWYDLAGRAILRTLRGALPGILAIDIQSDSGKATVFMASKDAPLRLDIARGKFSATNPHQLLVLMVFAGLVMTLIAFVFMRNQLTPITRMADAAEAFGRGQTLPYAPRGSTEVRAAGLAFLAMRARIERQIETRTLMLSGVSHDLRSPLTRLKLGVALLPQDDDTRALKSDIADMERLLDEFLAFARGDAMEEASPVDPADLLSRVVANAGRMAAEGVGVVMGRIDPAGPTLMRAEAVARALENLVGNALRYGTRVEAALHVSPNYLQFVIEDDGPGIPPDKRLRAAEPFARLDEARNPNKGGGVGLGLAIAADVARSHGGELRLGESPRLGGLRAELRIAR